MLSGFFGYDCGWPEDGWVKEVRRLDGEGRGSGGRAVRGGERLGCWEEAEMASWSGSVREAGEC